MPDLGYLGHADALSQYAYTGVQGFKHLQQGDPSTHSRVCQHSVDHQNNEEQCSKFRGVVILEAELFDNLLARGCTDASSVDECVTHMHIPARHSPEASCSSEQLNTNPLNSLMKATRLPQRSVTLKRGNNTTYAW